MTTTSIVVLVVLVLLAVAAAAVILRARRARERERLRERFGPEYERALEEHGDRRSAEKRLADVAHRRDALEIRDLDPAERERYAHQWTLVQAAFVDHPAAATRDADRLVGTVMRDRGYPVDDFETRADMVAADHPDVVEHYRAAHAVGSRSDTADTEELRQAFVHYRALFETLLVDAHGAHRAESQHGAHRAQSQAAQHAQGRGEQLDLTAQERTEGARHTRG